MTIEPWLFSVGTLFALIGVILSALIVYECWQEHRDNQRASKYAMRPLAEEPITQEPPDTGPGVSEHLPTDDSITNSRSNNMSKTTATVESLVVSLKALAKEHHVSDTFVKAFLKANGVGSTEHHTVTITASGDTFAEVRDRAVRVVTLHGPGYPESGFPVTSDGVTFEHSVTED